MACQSEGEIDSLIAQQIQPSLNYLEKSLFYNNFVKQMESSQMLSKINKILETDPRSSKLEMVFYGIGSFVFPSQMDKYMQECSCKISRLQLSLAILLKRNSNLVGKVYIYDPVISPLEIKIIEHLGLNWIPINEGGRRRVIRPTVFFMPHCEYFLLNNVLQANWIPQNLNKIVTLSNSFRYYKEKEHLFLCKHRRLPRENIDVWMPRYPLSILHDENTSEFALPKYVDDAQFPELGESCRMAFDNLSWHFFGFDGSSNDLDCLLKQTTVKSLSLFVRDHLKWRKSKRVPEGFQWPDIKSYLRQVSEECGLDPSSFDGDLQCLSGC